MSRLAVLLLLQIPALGARQRTVGLVRPLQLPDVALLFGHLAGLASRQLARGDTLLDALALMLLACVDTRIARAARVGLTRAHDGEHARDRQHCCGKLLHCKPPETAVIRA
jgi:hypothetical protein